jgi:putative ATP-binding cassette transporter
MSTESSQDQSDSFLSTFSQFLQNIKAIAGPYWYPTEPGGRAFSDVIRSWGMLILLILLIIGLVSVNAFNTFTNRYLTDIIVQEKDLTKFYNFLLIYAAGLTVFATLIVAAQFIRKKIALDWYQWLNHQMIDRYFSHRAYYKINFKNDLDNPDQRLSQELEPIPRDTLKFSATVLENGLKIITFIVILWSISKSIAVFLLVYAIAGNLIGLYLTRELDQINEAKIQSTANYNYCLTHVRTHAESIAFFQGEKQESNIVMRRFSNLLESSKRKIDWENNEKLFNKGYQFAIQLFPFIALGPLEIRGELDFGQVTQAAIASTLAANALGNLISEFGTLSQLSSYANRFSELSEKLDKVTEEPQNVSTIKTIEENYIAFEQVTLQTPDYEKVIVEDLSLSVQPGAGLLIVGPSGRGKSSLLRAIGGLWNAGNGRLMRPPLQDMLFLPQRPYIILGTLREQLLYPNTNYQISDQELEEVLQQVNLSNLLSRVDSLDTEEPWENILSLGEQQRLAFARLIITNPNFTILDEATSALDLENENNLYENLQKSQTTFISVGHRETLFNYHQWVLELSEDFSWQLLRVEDYQNRKLDINNNIESNVIQVESSPQSEPSIPPETVIVESSPQSEPSIPPEKVIVERLSHKEMQSLTNYSIGTIRTKASRGKPVTTKDGLTYRYNKNPKVLKWVISQ